MRKRKQMAKCEIVSVVCSQFVVSSRRHACRYETADGTALAKGYYVAVWPAGVCGYSCYGREVRYFGPYETVAVARIVQLSSLWMGLVEAEADGVDTAPLDPAKSNHPYRPDNRWSPASESMVFV
jgi:hypothetical protein